MNPLPLALLIGVAALIALLPLIQYLVKQYILRKAQQAQVTERDPLLVGLQVGKPALIYFTSPGCGPCHLTQMPIIRQLQQERGDSVQFLTVDITQQMDDALRWGVMKVPRTFVLDSQLPAYASNLDIARLTC